MVGTRTGHSISFIYLNLLHLIDSPITPPYILSVNFMILNKKKLIARRDGRAQELGESRGGRPGLPSLINLRFLWT